jgi:hypothetical protein
MLKGLNQTQVKEVMRQVGNPKGISPEGLEHAVEQYLESLQAQANVAKSFYFGRIEEGFQGMYDLPDDVRMQIDGLIWEAAGGQAIDPTAPESQSLIAAAIFQSVEMRMGMHDPE